VANPQPQSDQLGYESSLDLGVAALEHGLTAAAVPYLQQAVSFRSTRFALVQLGKAHRDLGQLEAARDRLMQARALPDGNDLFVLVTLAAVLCDLQEHGSAFEVAMDAARLRPRDPATLSVLARCMRESASTLEKHTHIDRTAIDAVLTQADEFAREAREAQPDAVSAMKDRRRRRAAQAWPTPMANVEKATPVEQSPAAILDHSVTAPQQAASADTDTGAVALPVAELHDSPSSKWVRAWRRATSFLHR
jgi:tetratricopeptide (TPR) repeat protein